MKYLVLFIKGLAIGIGKVIPGVSGSLIAISLHVYNDAIVCIGNLHKDFKNSFCFLFPLSVGILSTIIVFSRIILYFINTNYSFAISIIFGLILGTLPNYLKSIKVKYNSFIYLILLFIFFIYIYKIKLKLNMNIFTVFLLGIIEAITSIMPGISSTAIYMNFNIYNNFLNIFSNPFSLIFIIFSIGLIIGVFLISKVMVFLLKKYNYETNLVLFALFLSSVFAMFRLINLNIFNIILIIFGFVISYMFDK